jgi:N-acetylmuramoyl-L-alanine amidase
MVCCRILWGVVFMYRSGMGCLSRGKIIVFAVMIILAICGVANTPSVVLTDTEPIQVDQIIVDCGHGGIDSGAVGVHGEMEKDINLQIGLILRDMLAVQGFDVVMTREEDISLHDSQYTKIAQQKTSDIKKRLSIIDENPNSITVSIHQNKFSQGQYHGAQMFYGVNNPQSVILAQKIQDSIVSNLQPENQRQIKEGTNSVYLLMHASNPIVLVECGFLSNEQEAALLSTEEYQQKMAFAIFCGIMDYLKSV